MAKKKKVAASPRKSPSARSAARPAKPAKKSAAVKKKPAAARRAAAPPKAPVTKTRATPKNTPKKTASAALGRPKVPGDEPLFMLFKENYQARQVFDFLRVQTVKELEEYSPDEIIRRLAWPIEQTVREIRELLAGKNRCLAGDSDFARQFQHQGGRST